GADDKDVNRVEVACAQIKADDTLGAFAVQTAQLNQARHGGSAVLSGDQLYVIGGSNGDGQLQGLKTVEHATIGANGALGRFVVDPPLVTERAAAAVLLLGHTMFAIGGNGPSGPANSVESASFDSALALGAFATVPGVTLPVGVGNTVGGATGPSIYVAGGQVADGTATSVVSHLVLGL
ncbi:MAG TPA: kelch repeat-containing protein, partial [Kofleriaceae bacterium]